MAQRVVITCDVCGKDMPEEGIVLTAQDNRRAREKSWDICDACYRRLMETIASLKEE